MRKRQRKTLFRSVPHHAQPVWMSHKSALYFIQMLQYTPGSSNRKADIEIPLLLLAYIQFY